jgi:uncharacterized membrane protein (DUF106 family)
VIIITSQIAQILQYVFLNYHRLHKFRKYTSSTQKTTEALASRRSSQRGGMLVEVSAWRGGALMTALLFSMVQWRSRSAGQRGDEMV